MSNKIKVLIPVIFSIVSLAIVLTNDQVQITIADTVASSQLEYKV